MPSLHSIARSLDGKITRKFIAAAANWILSMRRDPRRFSTDEAGHWVNRQPGATFVSPDIFTGFRDQVAATVKDQWCLAYTPGPGDVVVDLGAGFGDEALIFSDLVGPSGRVIAVEAHPNTFACLEATIALSGATNVLPVHCAITDTEDLIAISDSDQHLANTIVESGSGVFVRGQSLDSLLDEVGVATVDLLKMNIEGAERAAMKGMANSAPQIRHVAISCHDFIADLGGSEQFRTRGFVEADLREYGFDVKQIAVAQNPWSRDVLFGSRAER